jgi:2-methylisocitrate lyase-like PEP mutase family enzyme
MTQREKAETLRALHTAPELLVMVNVWDAAGARTVAAVPGCKALATASWSIAAAQGLPDGEQLTRDAMLAAVEVVAGAVELPVSADLERGYGSTAIEVEETVTAAIAAGAVGCNLEDSEDDEVGPLRPIAEHADRVAAARAAGERAGVPLVINARTDAFLVGDGLEEAIERGRAYAIAGADCIFVPGAPDAAAIEQLIAGIDAPISVFGFPGGPGLAELERLGVARVSLGPGTMGVAMAALGRAAEALLAHEPLPADLAFRPPA